MKPCRYYWSNASIQCACAGCSLGPGDRVECYACGVTVKDWMEGQDPMLRHRTAAEACPVVEQASSSRSFRASFYRDSGIQQDMGSTRGSSFASASASASADYWTSGVTRTETALSIHTIPQSTHGITFSSSNQRYRNVDERKKSFRSSQISVLKAESLAKAGFFYIGPGDRVKCGFCGGMLKKWRASDSAIQVHTKYFPQCSFVQTIEKQSKVLSKNIRTVGDKERLMRSENLVHQYRQRNKTTKPGQLTKTTLQKMHYDDAHIHRAQRRLRVQGIVPSVQNCLMELQKIEKEELFGEAATGETFSSEGEDEEEDEELAAMASLSVTEVKSKLEREITAVQKETDELLKSRTCKVCLADHVDTILLTCKHLVMCKACADQVDQCPMCRETILGTIEVITR